MTRRFLSLLTALTIVMGLTVVSVSAAGNSDGWIELLEVSSMQSNGENRFEMKGQTTTVTLPIQSEKRLNRIEMLVWHQTADYPTGASVTANGSTTSLTVLRVDNNLSRIYGTIPNSYYQNLNIKFQKLGTGNAVWEMLSCRVTPVAKADYNADAEFWIRYDDAYVTAPGFYDYMGDGSLATSEVQFPVLVYDWQKYDSITISGSVGRMGLNSVRATINTTGVPYEITFTSTNATSEHMLGNYHYSADLSYNGEDYNINGYSDHVTEINYAGKVLFNITLDLTGIDRTMKNELVVYFTGVANGQYGFSVQVTGCVGSVNTADTAAVTWWNRFTTFMKSLFPTNTPEGEQFEGEAGEQAGEMDNLNDELQNVTRPPIEDVETDIEDYVSSEDMQVTKDGLAELMNNQLIVTTLMISLTISLVGYILYGKR